MVREDLVTSAVSFLQDPSVAASAIDQRIAFLQSKNLTQQEIDISLARAGDGSQSLNTTAAAPPPPNQYGYQAQPSSRPPNGYGYDYGPYQGAPWSQAPPDYPRRDWRDWFIMATVTSGVGYGLYTVAKVPFLPKKKTNLTLTLPQRYVLPLISPPTPPQLEADKASIDASFNGAFALIDQLATDTAELKEKETQRTEKLDTTLKGVDAVIEDLKEANKRRDVENRIIVDQIDGLKDQVPKALEGWKASGDAKLEELSQEMQSLKRLLENRVGRSGGTSKSTGKHSTPTAANENENAKDITSSPTSNNLVTGTPNSESPSTTSVPAPGITAPKQNDRKAIPAWQRAASEKSSNAASAGNSETSKAEAGA